MNDEKNGPGPDEERYDIPSPEPEDGPAPEPGPTPPAEDGPRPAPPPPGQGPAFSGPRPPGPPRPPRGPGRTPPGRRPPPGKGSSPVVWILVILGLFVLAVSILFNVVLLGVIVAQGFPGTGAGNMIEKRVQGKASDKVLLINVSGVISSGQTVLFLPSGDLVQHVKQRLRVAERNKAIKAVILKVDSPGGTVTASDEIFKAVEAFREKTGKPVISLMDSVAASGGYYVSMACDRVVAHRATLTGSIGVIMQFLNYKGLFEEHGLKWITITPENADLKDIGAADQEFTEKDRQVMQSMVEDMYDLFLDRVKAGRPNLSESEILRLADGRPYTGQQALDNGLVDVLGDLDTALQEARKIKPFAEDATVVEYRTITPFSGLFGMTGPSPPGGREALGRLAEGLQERTVPRFYYLYQR